MSERWRWVVGYEGKYQVSDRGRVRSMTCKGHPRLTPVILRPAPRSARYPHLGVVLYENGSRASYQVAHLVAEAFIGPRPEGLWVLHKNGDATLNWETNLYYGTPGRNTADSREHGTIACGERNGHSILAEADVLDIRRRLCFGEAPKVLAVEYGVGASAIRRIGTRDRWRHL